MPLAVAHVWPWFIELDAGRSSGMAPNPISYSEIYAWDKLTNRNIMEFEVRCIKAFDNVKLEFMDNASK